MSEKERIRQNLIKKLDRVKNRLKVLDLMDDKLLKMKNLAKRVVREDLSDKEIEEINKEVQKLEAEVNLLDRKASEFYS